MLSQAPSMRLGANKPAKNIKDVRSVFCSYGGGAGDGGDGGDGGVGDDGYDGDAIDGHTKANRSKPQTQFPYHIIVTTSSMFLPPGVHILHKRI